MLLNSILLEGSLLDAPIITSDAEVSPSSESSTHPSPMDRCSFNLDCGPKAPRVPVRAYGLLALRCSELLDRGSSVRIVGRVIHDTASSSIDTFALAVVCEHLEVKPSSRRSPARAAISDPDGF